jgi:hypothetical protein
MPSEIVPSKLEPSNLHLLLNRGGGFDVEIFSPTYSAPILQSYTVVQSPIFVSRSPQADATCKGDVLGWSSDILRVSLERLEHHQDPFSFRPIAAPNIFIHRRVSLEEIWRTVHSFPGVRDTTNSPDPLDQIFLQIEEVCNPLDRSEDTPALSVCAAAHDILTEADKINRICLDATAIEGSEGDLLIHWDAPAKSVVLICPRNGRAPSIYKETLDGVRPTTSQLLNDASAISLSEALAWVQSPTR